MVPSTAGWPGPYRSSSHVLIYRRRNWHFPFGRLTAHARTLRFRDIRQRFPVESRKHSADFTVEKRCGLENLAQIRSRGPNTLPTTEARRCASVNVEFIRTTQTDSSNNGPLRGKKRHRRISRQAVCPCFDPCEGGEGGTRTDRTCMTDDRGRGGNGDIIDGGGAEHLDGKEGRGLRIYDVNISFGTGFWIIQCQFNKLKLHGGR